MGCEFDDEELTNPWMGAVARTKTKSEISKDYEESLAHLAVLINLIIEWQTDWPALSATLPSGMVNPDYDPEYLERLRSTPEEVFDPAVMAARNFLKRVNAN